MIIAPDAVMWAWLKTLQDIQEKDDPINGIPRTRVAWDVLLHGIARHLKIGECSDELLPVVARCACDLEWWGVLWSVAVGRYVIYAPASRVFLFGGASLADQLLGAGSVVEFKHSDAVIADLAKEIADAAARNREE